MNVNIVFIIVVGNDYGFDYIFVRMVKVVGRKGDVLFVFLISGNFFNVFNVIVVVREIGMKMVGMIGVNGG